ncbi:conserved Plasmodium protein, unknown function [Plasmodium chabaudi adami]|uniref:Condensin complex subunit 2 n=1 Tax=Plasmodium chabaudi adami TaxID=5826 RepID=A0A1D3LN24_PLACE|nr:conserved Plasmodium protein, unknown function [Plasmodium chabaudi adami]
MKKLGVSNKANANFTQIKGPDPIFKNPIEFNKNLRRLSFLNNKDEDINKSEKNKVKEINDVFKNCMAALSHNKICTRNAFDIRIIDHLEDLVNLNDEEINEELNDELLETGDFNLSFTRASKAIEGATKVYGYRVEAIYDQTYNFISNMNIAKKSDTNDDVIDEKKSVNEITNKKMKKRKLEFFQESSTLAKPSDITIESVSVSNISVDTFFLKLNITYDHSSGISYLLPNLTLNNDLSIQFDGDIDTCEYKKKMKFEEKLGRQNIERRNEKNMGSNNELNDMLQKSESPFKIGEYVTFNDNDKIMTREYKSKLYTNSDMLRELFCGNEIEEFNNLNICPELDYFKEEIKNLKLKRSDSKILDDEDADNYNENDDTGLDKFSKKKNELNSDENISMDNLLGDMDGNNNDDVNHENMNDNGNFGDNNKILESSFNNNLNFDDCNIDDLNIENVMQESMAFDNMNLNDSLNNNLNLSQNMLSLHHNSNILGGGIPLPDLMKSENKDFSLINSFTGNFNFSSQNMLFKNQDKGSPSRPKNMLSIIPDDDTLWNRQAISFESRLNAIDVNSKFNYHYYNPSKLMINGNFANLMSMAKAAFKNKQGALHALANKKLKTSFDITDINFENLYIEVNDVELSAYDLWNKEKKKYISNSLFAIDQTSYIFETKDNCINCVNTVIDRIMKFSRPPFIESQNFNTDIKTNVILNEINNDYIGNDLDQINNFDRRQSENMFMDNMDDGQDYQMHEGLNDSIDKFYNMNFEDIWQNENKNDISKFGSKNDNTSIFQLHQSIGHANSLGSVMAPDNLPKFVDVSKIKKILFNIVKPDENEENAETEKNEENEETKKNSDSSKQIVPYEGEKTTTFKNIVNKTKTKLTESEVNGTSIHMLFVCLLYTCNDQELLLEKIENEEDFYVHYGLPVEFHIKQDDTRMLKN